jgi:hypothetical protein
MVDLKEAKVFVEDYIMIFRDIAATVGKTPMVELRRSAPACRAHRREARVAQPCGSVKAGSASP